MRTDSGRPQRVVGLRAALQGRRRVRVTAMRSCCRPERSARATCCCAATRRPPAGRAAAVLQHGRAADGGDGDVQNAYEGLQISHYGIPGRTGSCSRPGSTRPSRRRSTCPAGSSGTSRTCADTRPDGRWRARRHGGQRARETRAHRWPRHRLQAREARPHRRSPAASRMLGEILFAAGAKRLMVNTWGYEESRTRRARAD